MFFDETRIRAASGRGGDGCMSFRRERYVPKGGPDGGNGGRGGDVWMECDENVGDLRQFHFQPEWKARSGGTGMGRGMHGKGADELVLRVPRGTQVFDETGRLRFELLDHGARKRLLKGGEGGYGNLHFKSPTNQAPREITEGEPGQEGEFRLVLKTIADVGLVGFPNAGKSTILTALTNARPKIGAYPFTTLNPVVGITLDTRDYRPISLADIPGLIDGASENRGLGHRFLRHIERCRVLLFVLDAAGVDGREPLEDFAVLEQELEAYDPAFREKPWLVAANKCDLEGSADHLDALKARFGPRLHPISAESGEGMPALAEALLDAVASLRGSPEVGS